MLKEMIFGAVGGLGLFLFGMGLMSDGLKNAAGKKLKNLLEALTKHRIIAVLVGAGVTGLIQSSSATTVMTVGFVNAGLLTLKQALCVVLGANIGTTCTAWLVAIVGKLSITSYLPIVMVGFLFTILGKREKSRCFGQILIGFAILFVGMHFMKEAFGPLKTMEKVHEVLINVGRNPILAILAGTGITMLLQSSSASIALLIALASKGAFGNDYTMVLQVTIPYVLGDNIGTTITAQLAAIRASRNSKRAAMGHTLFNVIGVMYMLIPVYNGWFSNFVNHFCPGELSALTIGVHISFAHTAFNIFNTIVFLPLIGVLETIVLKILPISPDEIEEKPVALEEHLLHTPVIALKQTQTEILRMAKTACKALGNSVTGIIENDQKRLKKIQKQEDMVDTFQLEITSYLTDLSRRQLSDDVSKELPVLLHMVNDLERIGDHAVNILELADRKIAQKLKFSESAVKEAKQIQTEAMLMFDQVLNALETHDKQSATQAIEHEKKINDMQIQFRRSHVQRMAENQCPPQTGIIFIDLIDNIEKAADHLTNIAQAIRGGVEWTGIEPKTKEQ